MLLNIQFITSDTVNTVNWYLPEVWVLWDSSEKVLEGRVPCYYLCETPKVEKESYRLFQRTNSSQLLIRKSCVGKM